VHMRTAHRTRRTQVPAYGNAGVGVTPGVHEGASEVEEHGTMGFRGDKRLYTNTARGC
jgi:hypothetical protein